MTKQMAEQHLKFAIFGNEYQAKKSASIETILAFLKKRRLRSMWKMLITTFSCATSIWM